MLAWLAFVEKTDEVEGIKHCSSPIRSPFQTSTDGKKRQANGQKDKKTKDPEKTTKPRQMKRTSTPKTHRENANGFRLFSGPPRCRKGSGRTPRGQRVAMQACECPRRSFPRKPHGAWPLLVDFKAKVLSLPVLCSCISYF